MEYREFKAKTVEEAMIEAATTFGVASSSLDTVVVSKGTSGFLGIGAKPAVIKARPKNEESLDDMLNDVLPAKKEEKKESVKVESPKKETVKDIEDLDAPAEDVKSSEPIDESIIDDAKSYVEKLMSAMELESTVTVELDQATRSLDIDIEGPEMGIIIGKRGQTLDSLQYLISLYVNKKSNSYVRVKLDTENYRERRKETLENLAKNISFKVKKTRRPFKLEPMNPYERRIIHATLQNDKYVATKSEGEEPYRRVVVFPKRSNSYRDR